MDGKFAERIRAKEVLAAPDSSVDVAAHGARLSHHEIRNAAARRPGVP